MVNDKLLFKKLFYYILKYEIEDTGQRTKYTSSVSVLEMVSGM